MLIGTVIGITAGVIAAVRRGKASDYAATTTALLGLSVPHFWLGLLMIIVFAVNLNWLPASGYVPFREDPVENLKHMLMPAIVLGTGPGCGADAADAIGDARFARRRLRAHRPRQGPE